METFMKKAATRTIEQIDAEIAKLNDERRKLSEKLFGKQIKEGKNIYFRGVPKNPGVYHYSSESCATIGGAMGYWDGTRWHKIVRWGDFTSRGSPIVWHGE